MGTVDSGPGEPRVDAALRRLDELLDAPIEDQVAGFDDVHRLLQSALLDPDAR